MSDGSDVEPPALSAPLLQVVRGEPTDAELAAVAAVLLTRAASQATAPDVPTRRSPWSDGAGLRRPLPSPGADSWRGLGRR
ncbi:MAG TPA: acyl-CoA carboxylase subunit epsilon [Mycobacteriales bacterium]|nr:acyl-CoA carboxylase subunit epsilon [Mycobacteriales bacterium]